MYIIRVCANIYIYVCTCKMSRLHYTYQIKIVYNLLPCRNICSHFHLLNLFTIELIYFQQCSYNSKRGIIFQHFDTMYQYVLIKNWVFKMISMIISQTLLPILLALVSADKKAKDRHRTQSTLESIIPKKEFCFFGTLKKHNLNICGRPRIHSSNPSKC